MNVKVSPEQVAAVFSRQRSVEKTANILQVTPQCIRMNLRKAGVSYSRAGMTKEQLTKIFELKEQGKKWPEIAAALGFTDNKCWRYWKYNPDPRTDPS